MVDVEAVELAVADQVDAGLLLRVDDDPRGVDQRLLRGAATSQSGTGYEPTMVVLIRGTLGMVSASLIASGTVRPLTVW